MKKWIKNKSIIGFIIAFIMLSISFKYNLFYEPEKHKLLASIVYILFIISFIPYIFKDIDSKEKQKGCLYGKTEEHKHDYFEHLYDFITEDPVFFVEQTRDLSEDECEQFTTWMFNNKYEEKGIIKTDKKPRKILEDAFKEEFDEDWGNELRDFEHAFSGFFDATINAIKKAQSLSQKQKIEVLTDFTEYLHTIPLMSTYWVDKDDVDEFINLKNKQNDKP